MPGQLGNQESAPANLFAQRKDCSLNKAHGCKQQDDDGQRNLKAGLLADRQAGSREGADPGQLHETVDNGAEHERQQVADDLPPRRTPYSNLRRGTAALTRPRTRWPHGSLL
jgi:hypothetical protein